MELKDKYEVRQIFINLTNTRGLLWTDIVEGILFDKNGFLRISKYDVEIDENSLVDKLNFKSTEEVINYILVIDYLIDYLKKEYNLSDVEISTLLKGYLSECNISSFEMLKGEIGSWIIPSNMIIEKNRNIFKNSLIEIMVWVIGKNLNEWNKDDLYLKRQLIKKNTQSKIVFYIRSLEKNKIKELMTIYGKNDDVIWNNLKKELRIFIEEKKNSPTSS